MKNSVSIAFFAGCINKQLDIPPHLLYHSRLKDAITDEFKISPAIEVLCYYSYNTIERKVAECLIKSEPDILVLFIRPFPYLILNKLVIKYDTPSQKYFRAFHPALFSAGKRSWPGKYSKYIIERTPVYNGKKKINPLAELNLTFGFLTGLHWWSVIYVQDIIDRVAAICRNSGTRLLLLGVPPAAGSAAGNYLCRSLNNRLIKKAAKENLDYVDIYSNCNSNGIRVIHEDGRHFTQNGHEFLSEALKPYLVRMIREIL